MLAKGGRIVLRLRARNLILCEVERIPRLWTQTGLSVAKCQAHDSGFDLTRSPDEGSMGLGMHPGRFLRNGLCNIIRPP